MHSICIDTAYDRCKDNDKPNDDDNWKTKIAEGIFFGNYLMNHLFESKVALKRSCGLLKLWWMSRVSHGLSSELDHPFVEVTQLGSSKTSL